MSPDAVAAHDGVMSQVAVVADVSMMQYCCTCSQSVAFSLTVAVIAQVCLLLQLPCTVAGVTRLLTTFFSPSKHFQTDGSVISFPVCALGRIAVWQH